MYKIFNIVLATIIISIPFSVFAEDGDVFVGEVELSAMSWGEQTVHIELENKTDYVKFIITNTDLSFEGMYTNPEFTVKSIYILEPEQKITLSPKVFIPGNYGTVTINLEIYDVVDTLDALMPWTKMYEQPFKITFHPSDEVFPYLQEKVTFPPRVDIHPMFNNEFVRLLFTLLGEGKSIEKIAEMNNCDTSFVKDQINLFTKNRYLIKDGDSYKTNFPFISKQEAEAGKKIADNVSDKLASKITENYSLYFDVIDSLTELKVIPKDSNDFLSGATLLYKPTPVISTFVLWFDLGKKFITRSAPLLIYNGTDICNAEIIQYMYMVDGGQFLNGSHFFGLFYGKSAYSLMFSEDHLMITCKENFDKQSVRRKGVWKYKKENLPEFFIIDTTHVRPLITALTKETEAIMTEAYSELKKNALAHGQYKVHIGHRYWFWNLTATLTLEKLYKNGTLNKRGNSFFRYDKVKGR